MDLALSDLQALTLVVTCAAVAVLAIAVPSRWAVAIAAGADLAFSLWTRAAAGVLASTALLGLAVCVGTIVRLRRVRAIDADRALRDSVAAADARRDAAVLEERAYLAREIHDVLAHSLSALAIQLERVRLEVAGLPGGEHAATELARAHQLASRGLEDARGAIGALRGERSVQVADLEALVAEFNASTGIPSRLEAPPGEGPELDAATGLLLYRALQEAMTNAARHAHPTRIEARIAFDPDTICLEVVNDGVPDAAPLSDVTAGHGLQGLRERVALAGGTVDAAAADGRFTVLVGLPR